jgi:glycolate oxidase
MGLTKLKREFIYELVKIVGEEHVLVDEADRYPYGVDATGAEPTPPDVVVLPSSTEEVAQVLKLAYENDVPIIPRGSGSSVTGAVKPIFGGMVIDVSRMNRVLKVDSVNEYVVAEAGVRVDDLNIVLAQYGYGFPPDPASSQVATVGGVISTNAGGIRGAKYGTVKDWVEGLEVVIPTGEVIQLGKGLMKYRQGYYLTQLFTGAEGTLGVITKATLKIWPLPEKVVRILAFFRSIEDVGKAVIELKKTRIKALAMEFLDKRTLQAVAETTDIRLPDAEYAVIVDLEGAPESLDRYAKTYVEALEASNAFEVKYSTDAAEMAKLYSARKNAYPALLRRRAKPYVLMDDIVVPPTELTAAMKDLYGLAKEMSIDMGIFGHIGDGNLHPTYSADTWEEILQIHDKVAAISLNHGGEVSGEHGIGFVRKSLLYESFKQTGSCGAEYLMRGLKRVFDPKGLMNPGKLV